MHGPLQAKPADQEKYRGRYDEGWDRIRESRFASQLVQGLFPEGTQQAPRNSEPGFDVPEWDSLTPEVQSRFARYMEVYAAMVDSIDQSVGRIVDTLDELGELDNTIIVFTSDNGGTAEGGSDGTRSYFAQFAHIQDPDWVGDVPHDESLIGGPELGVHYPRGWGQTSNTPFRFYKGQSFAGGIRVPFLLSWPAGLKPGADDNGIRDQFAYVTDLTPTLLELAGIDAPSVRNGLPVKEFDGVSSAPVLRSSAAPSTHTEQYTEMTGNRATTRTAGNCWLSPRRTSTNHTGSCSTSAPTRPSSTTWHHGFPTRFANSPRPGTTRRGRTPCFLYSAIPSARFAVRRKEHSHARCDYLPERPRWSATAHPS